MPNRILQIGRLLFSTRQNVSQHLTSLFVTFGPCKFHSHAASCKNSQNQLLNFTHAIVRAVPKSFAQYAVRQDPTAQISMTLAISEMEGYIRNLKKCGLDVVIMPPDEKLPDSVFIEDTAVFVGKKACITCLTLPSRKDEVFAVKELLLNLGIDTTELDDPTARLEGGDVLFTGQEILVGISSRTNKEGAECLQRAFPEFKVTKIPVTETFHLKNIVTLAEEGLLVVKGDSTNSEYLKCLKSKVQGDYRYIQLSHDCIPNVLHVNGHVLIKPESDFGSDNFKKLTDALTIPWFETPFQEFNKADGCLTCSSLLVCMSRS